MKRALRLLWRGITCFAPAMTFFWMTMQWAKPIPPVSRVSASLPAAKIIPPQLPPLPETPTSAEESQNAVLSSRSANIYSANGATMDYGAAQLTLLPKRGAPTLYEEANHPTLDFPSPRDVTIPSLSAENDPADSRLTNNLNQVGWVALGLALAVISTQAGVYLFRVRQ